MRENKAANGGRRFRKWLTSIFFFIRLQTHGMLLNPPKKEPINQVVWATDRKPALGDSLTRCSCLRTRTFYSVSIMLSKCHQIFCIYWLLLLVIFILFYFIWDLAAVVVFHGNSRGKKASLNKRLDKMIGPTPGAADSQVIGGGLGPVSFIHSV